MRQVYRSLISMLNKLLSRMDLVPESLHSAANYRVHIGTVPDIRLVTSGNGCKPLLGTQLMRCNGVPESGVNLKFQAIMEQRPINVPVQFLRLELYFRR